jgi:hypothetical protein
VMISMESARHIPQKALRNAIEDGKASFSLRALSPRISRR